jgi:hypothetical protein
VNPISSSFFETSKFSKSNVSSSQQSTVQYGSFDKTTSGEEIVSVFQKEVAGKTCKRFIHYHPFNPESFNEMSVLIVVITGTSAGGLGAQTAVFLSNPKEILLLGRTKSKVTSVIDDIKSISPESFVKFIQVDLDRSESIRAAADTVNNSVAKIDILINNADIIH